MSKLLCDWSSDRTVVLSLRKNLSALHFLIIGLLKQYVVDCTRFEATEKNIIKEMGLFDGSLQAISFCPPETYKPNEQTTWNTSHLNGIAWSSGKLDYDKIFAVSYNIEVINAEMFAKGLEKSGLLTGFLGQNVEVLDDSGCSKCQDLVGEGKTDS